MKMKVNRYAVCQPLDMSFDEALRLQSELKQERKQRMRFALISFGIIFFIYYLFSCGSWIPALLISLGYIVYLRRRSRKVRIDLSVWFGLPGAGKSTICAALAKKWKKTGQPVFSNFPIDGTYKLDPLNDLGVVETPPGLYIIDEAGIDFNNRKYKGMPKTCIEWLKLHRHRRCAVVVMSQSHEDMDITFRRLAYRYYFVRKSAFIKGMICAIPIRRSIGIDELSHQITDIYKFDPFFLRIFGTRRFWGPKYWSMFDSFEAPELEHKQFELWSDSESKWDSGPDQDPAEQK